MTTLERITPVLIIDFCIGIVGFIVSIGWLKVTGREMDAGTLKLLLLMWIGITLFGVILFFVM